MTGKPQFEHKNPRFFGPASYNRAVASPESGAGGNDVSGFGLMALPKRGAAAGGRPGQTGLLQ